MNIGVVQLQQICIKYEHKLMLQPQQLNNQLCQLGQISLPERLSKISPDKLNKINLGTLITMCHALWCR